MMSDPCPHCDLLSLKKSGTELQRMKDRWTQVVLCCSVDHKGVGRLSVRLSRGGSDS